MTRWALVALLMAVACSASPGGKRDAALALHSRPTPRVEAATPSPLPAPSPSAPTPTPPLLVTIPYRVEVRSPDPALATAPVEIATILEDPRGWQQAGYDFVEDPGAPFVIAVAEGEDAQQLCLPYDVGGQFSCQNGPLVVLNAIRWREGVAHWPYDLASYRQMLVSHEVGHLLGMHHIRCPSAGAVAPVMEQQSGSLRGCQANPWPTPIELRLAATHEFQLAPPPE